MIPAAHSTILALMFLLFTGGSDRDASMHLQRYLIGTWVVDVERSLPRSRQFLEDNGFSAEEIEERVALFRKTLPTVRLVFDDSTLTSYEMGEKTSESPYKILPPDRIVLKVRDRDLPPAKIVYAQEDRLIIDDGKSMSLMVFRRAVSTDMESQSREVDSTKE
jgi:hypothetical protein